VLRRSWLPPLGALGLVACVHVPIGDQLIRYREGGVVRTGEADCARGWSAAPAAHRVAALDPAGFDLVTWNIRRAQAESWPRDFARLVAGRDILLLQEARLTPGLRAALEGSGYRWTLARAFDLRGAHTGVLTASQVEASAACLTRSMEPLTRVPKSALLTRFPLRGSREELLVANLHGVNFAPDTRRFGDQLESVAGRLASHRGPLVLAGDFNDWRRGRSQVLRGITGRLGLRPLRLTRDKRSRHLGRPVDHVFYRGLEVVRADAVEVTSSDHHPVRVSFSLAVYRREELK